MAMTRKDLGNWLNNRLGEEIDWSASCFTRRVLMSLKRQLEREETCFSAMRRFQDDCFPGWEKTDVVYLTNALAGEVGEVCNDAKHLIGGGCSGKEVSRLDLLEELADVYLYVGLTAMVLGYDDATFKVVVMDKIEKNRERMAEKVG